MRKDTILFIINTYSIIHFFQCRSICANFFFFFGDELPKANCPFRLDVCFSGMKEWVKHFIQWILQQITILISHF